LGRPLSQNNESSQSIKKKIKIEESSQEAKSKFAPYVEDENVKENWIVPGLIVKVMNKNIADGQFYGKKGLINDVHDLFVGQVKILENNIVIKIDQSQLETVIPGINCEVAIVNGKYRGRTGILKSVDFDKFKTIVEVDGEKIEKEYEEICKFAW